MMEGSVPRKTLRDGFAIPMLGLGTYMTGGEAVSWALQAGYRLIDTASLYQNEDDVGRAIRESGIPREDIYVVTKLWNSDHGRRRTIKAFEESLSKLGLEYVDLYLMHSAMGGKTVETWDAMCELKERGLTRSVGVANFNAHHLTELKNERPDSIPVVNQIETHPFLAWNECVTYCQRENIAIMAYSPLAKAEKMKDPTLCKIARQYSKSSAQIMIKWSLQNDFICIPKSSRKERIAENFNIFDFRMSERDVQTLSNLDDHYITDWPGAMSSNWLA